MKLGTLIDKLAAQPLDLRVRFRRLGDAGVADGISPGGFASYRGYYDRLMLDTDPDPLTAGELLERARKADGATYEGYKGGEYTMSRDTLVHVAEYGCTSRDRIVHIEQRGDEVALIVAHVPEEWD